jgi:hypothetical protein
MTVRFFTPDRLIAGIKFSGIPERPKPPAMIVMPSNSSPSRAASASGKIFCVIGGRGPYPIG